MDRSAAVRFSRRRALVRFATVVALLPAERLRPVRPLAGLDRSACAGLALARKTATRHTDAGPAVADARRAIANAGAAACPGQADVPDGRAAHRSQPKPRPS